MYRAPAALIIAIFVLNLAHAQDDPRAIVERAMKAAGGEANLTRFKARHNKVKGTVQFEGQKPIPFTQEVHYQAPNQIKETMSANVEGVTRIFVTILNGDKASIQVDGKAQEVSEKLLAELKESAHLAQVSRFIGLKDKPYELTALPEAQVNGKPAVGVKIAAKGQRDLQFYFDKDSGLLVKTERKVLDVRTDQLVTEESIFSGWKEMDGLQTPMRLVVNRNGKKFMEAEATEVRHLEKLEDAVFAKP